MAQIIETLFIAEASEAAADRITHVALVDNTTNLTRLTDYKVPTFGNGTAAGVDLSSNIDFTIPAGATVGGVDIYQFDGSLYLRLAAVDFATTYSFPDGGTFTLDGLVVKAE